MSLARQCVVVAMTLAVAAAVAAAAAETELACPRVETPPTVDGRLDDWPPLPMVSLGGREDWRPAAADSPAYGGRGDLAAGVWMAWDDDACYLAVQVTDDTLVRARSLADVDQGDSIVLAFAGPGGEVSSEFVIAPLRSGYPVYRAKPVARAGEARRVSVGIGAPEPEEKAARQLTYEVAVPWSELSPLRARPGERFSVMVSVADDDGTGLEGCLERPLMLALWQPGLRPLELGRTALPPMPSPHFLAPEAVRFDRERFVVHGREVFLYGGEIAYARLPRESWPAVLSSLKAAGMNLASVTVPWCAHEPGPGAADLTALDEFLSLCGREGVWVQVNIGPYAGERLAGGGVPGWALALEKPDRRWAAIESWLNEVVGVVRGHEVSAGGPVISVVLRPLPEEDRGAEARALTRMMGVVRKLGLKAPLLTVNLPSARDNLRQGMADVLDTLMFYTPPASEELLASLGKLAGEENGPPVISVPAAEESSAAPGGGGADWVKLALAGGAKAVVIGDFATGACPCGPRPAVMGVGGDRSPQADELNLVAAFLRQFQPHLLHGVPAPGVAQCDDPAVAAIVRVTSGPSFLFVSNQRGEGTRHVRVTYTDPASGETIAIPEAGAMALPSGRTKALVLNLPVGRGVMRYSTSEVLGVGRAGERTVLVVYGEADTPGELSLSWPGPPLVVGELVRQAWDPDRKIITIDYFHAREDRYVLVDELEIMILSRERARHVALVEAEGEQMVVSGGVRLAGAAVWPDRLEAAFDCPPGETLVTLPTARPPAEVLVDGRPVPFDYRTPERVVRFSVATPSFDEERRPASVWQQLGRAIQGGPPLPRAEFDRGWFMGDQLQAGAWRPLDPAMRAPEELGIGGGEFVRLRARFDPGARTRLAVNAHGQLALVFLNGRLVPELSAQEGRSEAEVAARLRPGENEILILLLTPLRPTGRAGVEQRPRRLPEVSVVGPEGATTLSGWEWSAGLGGEALGWHGPEAEVGTWHLIRFGPWREQGRGPAQVEGIGWYRVSFGLPEPRQWTMPYQVVVEVSGRAVVWLNGRRLGLCPGPGAFSFPVPAAWLWYDRDNVLATAVCSVGPDAGLRRVKVQVNEETMTRRRAVEVRF